MSAMDSSSRNAGEMLDRLTLTYNRYRFLVITCILVEVFSRPNSEAWWFGQVVFSSYEGTGVP